MQTSLSPGHQTARGTRWLIAGAIVLAVPFAVSRPQPAHADDAGTPHKADSLCVQTKTFDHFVLPSAQGDPLGTPWYLTFGKTDPATLAYGD